MLFVITVQVTGTNLTYWAYIPNPPINKGVSWEDTDILLVVNESSWLPSSYNHRGPAKSEVKVTNYTHGVQEIPVCIGNGTDCLSITFQIWLSLVIHNTTQYFHSKFYMLHVSGFRGD